MISIIPRPYLNEIIYSWIFRYHFLNGSFSSTQTFKELFNREVVYLNLLYPTYLDCLVSKLPKSWEVTPENLIYKHTIFSFFKPFLSEHRVKKTIGIMKKGDTSKLSYYMGIEAGEVFKNRVIKVCPICDEENTNKFQETYLNRIHQIPGNYICTKHNTALKEYIIPDHAKDTEFISVEKCNLSDYSMKHIYNELYELSKEIDLIMDGTLKNYDIDKIKEKYRKKLEVEGYKSLKGRVNQKKLMRDFLNHYSAELLEKLQSPIYENKSDYWLKLITHKSYNYPIHPMRHLLFIKFLFGGVKQFVDFEEEYKPFGEEPWICLNPVADHSDEPVMQQCEVKKRYEGKGKHITLGTFRCECGFEYTIRESYYNSGDIYKKRRIINFGHIWEDKLKELLSQNKYSLREIAQLMGTNKTTVGEYRDKITSPLISPNNNTDKKSKNLKIYKEKIKIAIAENNEITRTDIRNQLSKEYLYLRNNEPEWLEKNLPEIIKYVPPNKDLSKKDKEMKERVITAIQEILKDEGKPRRISLAYLAKKVNYSGIRSKELLKKLPLTRKAIEDNMESIEEYKKRRIRYIIKQMNSNNENITLSNIIRHINCQAIGYEKIKRLVNEWLNDEK
ncbi:TnsD family Tn7-like transposition protein [Brassicibacter mesophilus]|uniref:TnsD family Tn7-like transposition protein n=1 Tax=Brassicibacter mesophilus TaxID=745119 RepID=UPI003D2564DF